MFYLISVGALAYALAFIFNDIFFKSFWLNENIDFIFLPSGVRIFLVLVFNIYGAISIAFGSLFISLYYLNESNPVVAIGTSLTIAITSLFSRWTSFRLLNLNFDLQAIKFDDILVVAIIFSAINSIGQQILLYKLGTSKNFVSDGLLMFTGDVMGALLCLLCTKYVLHLINYKKT